MRRAARSLSTIVLISAAAIAAGVAALHAAETQWWIVDQATEHAESELRGVTVRPEGAIELGPRASSASADSLGTIWAIAPLRDGSVALAGDRGRIDRWTSRGVVPWVRLPVGQVLALASDGDGVVAGTGPEGAIYRIGAKGDTSLVARTGERYVWGLAPAGPGAWYAATGTLGRLMRVEKGRVRVVLDTEESNLVSLISDGRGGAYVGGDSRGRVVHVSKDGAARTLFDAAEDEVRALAIGADGALYAAALASAAVSSAPPAAGAGGEGPEGDDEPAAAALAPSRPAPGGRAVVYRIVPDSAVVTWWVAPQPLIYALARTPRGLAVATGNRAGIYVVPRAGGAQAWLSAPQGQITALAATSDGTLYAAASNPAALWRLGPGEADRGELTSAVLDARRIARWGRAMWHAEGGGSVQLATRSGNTDKPDTTWSRWQPVGNGARVSSPAARYLQWKLTLAGGKPRVEAVDVAWREQNLAPRVEDLIVAPQGVGFREGDLVPRSEPVTQTLPNGQKVEYSIQSPVTPQQLRGLPSWASGLRTVQWKASDPNNDPLRYRLEVGRSADGPWTELATDLETPAFTWDTHTLSDGRYRLRVVASDAGGNAVGEERSGDSISEAFQVDNVAPEITSLEATPGAKEIRVRGAARDGASPLARVEVAVDSGPWRPISPDGGFTDDREHAFRAVLSSIPAGVHAVAVRVADLAGNTATRATQVTVPTR